MMNGTAEPCGKYVCFIFKLWRTTAGFSYCVKSRQLSSKVLFLFHVYAISSLKGFSICATHSMTSSALSSFRFMLLSCAVGMWLRLPLPIKTIQQYLHEGISKKRTWDKEKPMYNLVNQANDGRNTVKYILIISLFCHFSELVLYQCVMICTHCTDGFKEPC